MRDVLNEVNEVLGTMPDPDRSAVAAELGVIGEHGPQRFLYKSLIVDAAAQELVRRRILRETSTPKGMCGDYYEAASKEIAGQLAGTVLDRHLNLRSRLSMA